MTNPTNIREFYEYLIYAGDNNGIGSDTELFLSLSKNISDSYALLAYKTIRCNITAYKIGTSMCKTDVDKYMKESELILNYIRSKRCKAYIEYKLLKLKGYKESVDIQSDYNKVKKEIETSCKNINIKKTDLKVGPANEKEIRELKQKRLRYIDDIVKYEYLKRCLDIDKES